MHPPRGSRPLQWLFCIQLLSMGAMDMSGPFWPLHLRELGSLTAAQLGWVSALVYAGPMFAAMCFAPAWGALADRLGHKPMLLRALIALCLTQLWVAFADDVTSVLVARFVQGALAGFIAASQAYGAQLVSPDQRAGLMARLQVATALGSVGGPFLGGVLYGSIGFRTLNLIAAAICAACTLAAFLVLPATAAGKASSGKSSAGAPSARQDDAPLRMLGIGFVGLLAGIVLVQSARMLPQAFFGVYVEQALALPPWITGLCYGLTALGLCLAAPLWGQRFENAPNTRVMRELEWVAWACVGLALLQSAGMPLAILLAARFAWGLCLGALLPVFYALLSREAPGTRQGRVLGWGNSAAKAGALVGTLLGGLALAWVPLHALMWSVALSYAGAALGLRLLRRRGARNASTLGASGNPAA